MIDESAEAQTKRFVVRHREVTRRPKSHSRGTRSKSDNEKVGEKGLKIKRHVEEIMAEEAIGEALKAQKSKNGEEVTKEITVGLPPGWGRRKHVTASPGYERVMTRTQEPTQRPTLSGKSLERAQKEAREERAVRHFGRGSGRYGK